MFTLQAVVATVVSIVGFFVVRTLMLIDKNQTELFNRIRNLEKDFYTLKGEHDAIRTKVV